MRLRAIWISTLLAITAASCTPAFAAGNDGIDTFLTQTAYDWNHGNLDAFMRGYENAPTTLYISSTNVIHGYAAIRARYASHYGSSMGVLSFSDLTKRMLGADYAVIVAHWHLAMTNGTHPTGIFSLVLHRSSSGWHIIDDHTP
jgi:beta-aspartyl-peptidase (threonine type)